MNGLLWALLTNRTLLWRYKTHDVCVEYDTDDTINCDVEYNPTLLTADCHTLIERNHWIPSYDHGKQKARTNHANDHQY
jgi:hypothetical protein